MAQYWLEIASEADISRLQVLTTGALSYSTDGGIPVAVFTSTTAVGEYLRFLDVPLQPTSSVVTVAALYRVASGASGPSCGPSLYIHEGDGFTYGKTTGTTYRASKSLRGGWAQLASNVSSQPAGSGWGWMEITASSGSFQCRNWTTSGSRPVSAQSTFNDAPPVVGTDSAVGFGASDNIQAKKSHLRVIAVGTDGDPAPTGPVGGVRQRSRLILTPW